MQKLFSPVKLVYPEVLVFFTVTPIYRLLEFSEFTRPGF